MAVSTIAHPASHYPAALASAIVATVLAVLLIERRRWTIGIAARPQVLATELACGLCTAMLLIFGADQLVTHSSQIRHVPAGGLPWHELLAVFIPASIQEELLFRGYCFQKLRTWSREGAIAASSIVFAALHLGNRGIGGIAVINLVIAGVLLCLAYEATLRLWLPIGIHVGWNILSGPVLGYPVSGYIPSSTVMRVVGSGRPLITGAVFGIEGSIWMVPMELLGIAALLYWRKRRPL